MRVILVRLFTMYVEVLNMSLKDIFDTGQIKLKLESETKEESFEELIETIASSHPELDRREMLAAVMNREREMNTGIIPGVAVPHGYCRAFSGIVGAIGISPAGIAYDTDDRQPVHCIFMLLLGGDSREHHLRVLGELAALFQTRCLSEIQTAQDVRQVRDILSRF
jgi:mannitol/fructose-specific phosphotransferase system IIA component (Ntr-type)